MRLASWARPADLVFAEPVSGEVLRRGALMRRYRRTLQEWMGHRDMATTQRYADYAPNEREVEMVDRAFGDDQVA